MSAACKVCQGSGETIRGSGIYDCQADACNAATERAALEDATPFEGQVHPADALWIGYQAGKAAALEQATKLVDLIGEDWDNAGIYQKLHAAEYLAKNIRALKP